MKGTAGEWGDRDDEFDRHLRQLGDRIPEIKQLH